MSLLPKICPLLGGVRYRIWCPLTGRFYRTYISEPYTRSPMIYGRRAQQDEAATAVAGTEGQQHQPDATVAATECDSRSSRVGGGKWAAGKRRRRRRRPSRARDDRPPRTRYARAPHSLIRLPAKRTAAAAAAQQNTLSRRRARIRTHRPGHVHVTSLRTRRSLAAR